MSLATDTSEDTRQHRIKQSVVQKSVEKQALADQVKRKQDIASQKEDLEELCHQFRSRLLDEKDLQNLKESELKGL